MLFPHIKMVIPNFNLVQIFFFFLIDKVHKYIDQKSIQEVYKAKAEKTAKAKSKKQQTKTYHPLRMIRRSGKYNQLKRDLTQDRHKPKKKESYKRKTLLYLKKMPHPQK